MLAIPIYNQLNDPLPDGQPDPQAQNDCGEECVSMLLPPIRAGMYMSAGAIRQELRGGNPNGSALTTAGDLVRALHLLGNIPAHERAVDFSTFQIESQHALENNMPIIALGYWEVPTIKHWMIAVAVTTNGLMFNDPWNGIQRALDWNTIHNLYQNDYVHIDIKYPTI